MIDEFARANRCVNAGTDCLVDDATTAAVDEGDATLTLTRAGDALVATGIALDAARAHYRGAYAAWHAADNAQRQPDSAVNAITNAHRNVAGVTPMVSTSSPPALIRCPSARCI